jgi:hypothetical protein
VSSPDRPIDMAGPMCMKIQMGEGQGLIRMENLRDFLS